MKRYLDAAVERKSSTFYFCCVLVCVTINTTLSIWPILSAAALWTSVAVYLGILTRHIELTGGDIQ